ncbi:two-component system sensor histidine kinase NtrB [Metabacillus sp. HB246100]
MNDLPSSLDMKKLEKENALLRDTLLNLPISFTYHHPDGYTISKGEKDGIIHMEKTTRISSDTPSIQTRCNDFKEIEAFLTSILDFVPHHIVFVDKDGIVTLCNVQTAKDLEVHRDDIIGKHIRELLRIPDDQIAILESIRTEKEFTNKEVLDTNYGIINTRIIRDSDGSISRVIGTFYFLNVIKEAEKQALAGRIAAGIAHEIRNPLTTVRGYLQFLSHDDEEKKDLFTKVLIPEIDRANKIITDFLSIAKPANTSTETLNVKAFLTDYLGKFLKTEALLYNAELFFDLHPQTKNVYLLGHSDELLQVFMNLLRNSLQAKGENPLKITVKTALIDHSIQIHFIDNGKGIPSSLLPHVFDPFFTTKDEGTGLGLSVSKKIIENHRGTMSVTSDERGTKFTINIPVSKKHS